MGLLAAILKLIMMMSQAVRLIGLQRLPRSPSLSFVVSAHSSAVSISRRTDSPGSPSSHGALIISVTLRHSNSCLGQ